MSLGGIKKYAVVVAGGKGLRMGADMPKQFICLADRPILFHTLDAFYKTDPTIDIVLVLPEEQQVYWQNLCQDYGFTLPHRTVSGGETRFDSVKNAVLMIEQELSAKNQPPMSNALIGVHDGVRPLIDSRTISTVYERADLEQAAFPAIAVTDSVRKLTGSGKKTVAVDRKKYLLVQTPQVFRANILIEAYRQVFRPEFTDDVSVVEAAGLCNPVMVEGSRKNIKITTPFDLLLAKSLITL